jgi:predicted unusual protein kinase regulating ubiquinone biosynthesis (AarF/ABC1/UbiB family)
MWLDIAEIFLMMERRDVSHGDLHTKNILVRANEKPRRGKAKQQLNDNQLFKNI